MEERGERKMKNEWPNSINSFFSTILKPSNFMKIDVCNGKNPAGAVVVTFLIKRFSHRKVPDMFYGRHV